MPQQKVPEESHYHFLFSLTQVRHKTGIRLHQRLFAAVRGKGKYICKSCIIIPRYLNQMSDCVGGSGNENFYHSILPVSSSSLLF